VQFTHDPQLRLATLGRQAVQAQQQTAAALGQRLQFAQMLAFMAGQQRQVGAVIQTPHVRFTDLDLGRQALVQCGKGQLACCRCQPRLAITS